MRLRTLFLALGVLACAPATAAAAPFGFALPHYVNASGTLAGGEPVLQTDPIHHTLVYSSHEGTTHIYQPGIPSQTTFMFLTGYRNQVNNWTSSDGGKTWKQVSFNGTGFTQTPDQNTGFSDPDLTQDAGGRIYNTGIDLANDALFSSADGGKTWDRGTFQCHDGDRPWLSGGKRDEVFLATNTAQDGHEIFQSINGGTSCDGGGPYPDEGTIAGTPPRNYTGNGKMLYDRSRDMLVEPIDIGPGSTALGVGTWKRGDAAFKPHIAVTGIKGGYYAHWPMIALDDAGGLYIVWDDDPRTEGSAGGCNAAATPATNAIRMAYSPDLGDHWSAPVVIASTPGHRVLWPWVTAGDPGKVNVVWYETNNLADLACQKADLRAVSATVLGANGDAPQVLTADVAGRPISFNNNICQSGTTCAVTGEDRRLGDFFTNGIDERGCVMVATGDTTSPDPGTNGPRNIALPLFVLQNSGPALRGGGDCSGEVASLLPPSSPGTAPGAGGFGEASAGSGSTSTGAPSGSSAKRCVSARKFRIRLRTPNGDKLSLATIYIAGKKRYTLRGKKLTAPVNLTGLPKGVFTVRVQAVGTSGKRYTDLRTYRTCVPKRKTKAKKHTLKPKRKATSKKPSR